MKSSLLKTVCLFWLLHCSACVNGVVYESTPIPTLPPVTITSSTLPLQEQWRYHTGLPNAFLSFPSFLLITNDKVIISFLENENVKKRNALLTALSLEKGELIWQTPYRDPDFGAYLDDSLLFPEIERLYLVYSFQVSAFDLVTGKSLWPPLSLAGHTSYRFVQDSRNPLQLRTSDQKIIAIDPDRGEILSRDSTAESFMTFEYNQYIISYNGLKELSVKEQSNRQVLWKFSPFGFSGSPTFLGDDMLIQRDAPIYRFFRVNIQTGNVVWAKAGTGYISNYAVSGDRVYALQENGLLQVWSLVDGQAMGEMRFDREFAKVGSVPFWIASQKPWVLIYLGDSQELIAFKEPKP